MKSVIPSMFHRRLVLIGAAYSVAIVALGLQLGRLTLARGAELRAQAEQRLRYAEWIPTTRGRILDRKGRVLAHDRACYHVAVDYRVITGAWASAQAREYASRRHAREWRRLPAPERDALTARYLPTFERHLDAAWGRVALAAGVPASELGEDRREIVETVESMASFLRGRWVEQYLAQHAQTGRSLEPDDQRRLERLRAQPTAEQQSPHVLIRAVSDEVAFELLRLGEATVTLDPAGTGDSGDTVVVPLLPGLVVEDGATREYPFESLVVDIDQRTLPLPLRADGRRSVPAVGVLSDVLGWMGTPTREVIERRDERRLADDAFLERTTGPGLRGPIDLGQYLPGDLAGTRGLEARFEAELRGLRGQRIVRRDTQEQIDVSPVPGRDLSLTIDVMLQARVQAVMSPQLGLARVQAWHANHALPSGTDLAGAAVVLDVDTGEILAMVSTPGATEQERRRAEARVQERVRLDEMNRLAHASDPQVARVEYRPGDDPDAMLRFNRAIGTAYAPGSIAKVVVLLEGVRQGVYRLGERITCTGHLLERDPNRLRCWIYKRFGVTHNDTIGHDLSASEALTASCNIFFYTLGRRLGPAGVRAAYQRWGVGQGYDLGIGPVARGVVDVQEVGQAILSGIGQGPVTWTPMHAADAMATIARGGVRLRPVLVPEEQSADTSDLGLDPEAVRAVINGLDGAVHDAEHGTGHHITFVVEANGRPAEAGAPGTRELREPIFTVPGIRVIGKTGTATAGATERLDERGQPVLDDLGNVETVIPDHSWYVVLVEPESGPGAGRLKYAVAVMMENAGSGGKVSGPICNQIVQALVEEGYLPRVDAPSGGVP